MSYQVVFRLIVIARQLAALDSLLDWRRVRAIRALLAERYGADSIAVMERCGKCAHPVISTFILAARRPRPAIHACVSLCRLGLQRGITLPGPWPCAKAKPNSHSTVGRDVLLVSQLSMRADLDSRAEYERRLHRVLAYIDTHLDEPVDLPRLAKVASFSAFHFHRIFSAHLGETLGTYVTRRRVEQAAARLASQPRLSVLTVALAVGFGSPEAFTRAFKKHFHCTPSQWKARPHRGWDEESKISQVNSRLSQDMYPPKAYAGSMAQINVPPLQVAIKKRPPVRIAYLRYQGPFGEPIGKFWQEKAYPWLVSNNLLGVPRYGISQDDPQVTAKNKCRYDAAAEIGDDYVPSQDAQITTLAGGLYACTKFKGTSAEVPKMWEQILREWVPASGYQLDARNCFEYYPPDGEYDEQTGAFTCELCIPIMKL